MENRLNSNWSVLDPQPSVEIVTPRVVPEVLVKDTKRKITRKPTIADRHRAKPVWIGNRKNRRPNRIGLGSVDLDRAIVIRDVELIGTRDVIKGVRVIVEIAVGTIINAINAVLPGIEGRGSDGITVLGIVEVNSDDDPLRNNKNI